MAAKDISKEYSAPEGPKGSPYGALRIMPPIPAPAQQMLSQRLGELCRGSMPVCLLWFNLKSFGLFSKLFGQETAEQILEYLNDILRSKAAQVLPKTSFVLVERVDSASYAVIFQDGPVDSKQLAELALNFRLTARQELNTEVVSLTGQNLALEVGCSRFSPQPEGGLLTRLLHALEDARQAASEGLDMRRISLMDEFRQLIQERMLYSVYQPIVDLRQGSLLGWEALARGPAQGYFASPKAMFDFAEEVGSLFQLERCCRERAISGLGRLGPNQKIFLNIHPKTLGDPKFRPGETKRLLEEHGLKTSNVVFEITERHSIKDFSLFHRTLDHYRSQGFKVAIDDVGTGFSGLNRIASLRPDYIKADMGLVQNIDSNPVQRALLETLVTFADKIGCSVIAEGIETGTELSCLMAMGVHYGQGFYLARPACPKPQAVPNIQQAANPNALPQVGTWKCSLPISQLVDAAPQVPPQAKVREVKLVLDEHPISGVVVVDEKRPVGLVMSHRMDRKLGTQYGSALYYDRSVDILMDTSPLIVDCDTPVEQVAQMSMGRERFKIYDHIVVTRRGLCIGLVSVQRMLDALARVQVEMAKGANPLTGLPGGLSLETEIEKRCAARRATSFIYVDLDNFKVFNDNYGFKAGDKMLTLTARILTWATSRHGGTNGFVGHVGGDDFVVITDPGRAERLCQAVLRCFARLVPGLYNHEDRQNGFVIGKGRDGVEHKFPLVTLSLGIVDCQGQESGLLWVGQQAAEVKRWAKSKPGNVYVRDRRRPLPLEIRNESTSETAA